MLATGLSFVAVTGTVRHLGTALPSVEAAFLRFVIAFGEPVDPYIRIGGAMIIGAISYMTWREAQIRRQAVTSTAVATKV